jgi:hypothetical protein
MLRQLQFILARDMSFGLSGRKIPLLGYSQNPHQRATLLPLDHFDRSMPGRRRNTTAAGGRRRTRRRRSTGGRGKTRVVKGRVSLRIPGFGVTKLSPSELVRHIPVSKLKTDARKVLGALGKKKKVKRGRKRIGRKRRTRRRQI